VRKYDYADDTSEKLVELQEAVQKLQLLKQIGAETLALKQEKEIFKIQEEIRGMNEDSSLDVVDTIPRKCRFCTVHKTDDERLMCFEENYKTCKQQEPPPMNAMSASFLKILFLYGILLLSMLCFLLLSNILFLYIDNRLVVFIMAFVVVGSISILFRKPISNLIKMLG
jgi:hypothetical protein